jgi:uncharacterized protein with FMN-binding domain
MSKRGLIIAFAFLVAIIMMSIFSTIKKYQTENYVKKLPVSIIDLSTIADGNHTGSFSYSHIGYKVNVSILEHRITAIEILKGPLSDNHKKAEAIIDAVIAAQSLQVDQIKGAAFESKLLLKALDNALTGAK